MTRIAPLEAPYPAEVQASFDAIMTPGVPPLLLFRTVAASPRAWAKMRGGSLLDRGPLSLRAREIVIDRTSALCGNEYEWGVHVSAFADKARLTAEQVAATVHGPADAPCWSAAEQALITCVDALHRDASLDDATFARLHAHYDRDQVLEILQLCGFYRMVAYLVRGLALPLEPWAARFPAA